MSLGQRRVQVLGSVKCWPKLCVASLENGVGVCKGNKALSLPKREGGHCEARGTPRAPRQTPLSVSFMLPPLASLSTQLQHHFFASFHLTYSLPQQLHHVLRSSTITYTTVGNGLFPFCVWFTHSLLSSLSWRSDPT